MAWYDDFLSSASNAVTGSTSDGAGSAAGSLVGYGINYSLKQKTAANNAARTPVVANDGKGPQLVKPGASQDTAAKPFAAPIDWTPIIWVVGGIAVSIFLVNLMVLKR